MHAVRSRHPGDGREGKKEGRVEDARHNIMEICMCCLVSSSLMCVSRGKPAVCSELACSPVGSTSLE